MAVDIFITDAVKKRKLQLPSLPDAVSFSSSTQYASYSILDLGAINLPSGRGAREISWEAYLFGERRKNEPFIRSWKAPKEVQTILSEWRDAGTKLNLVITETPINMDVTISEFTSQYSGAFGDYYYSITLLEYKEPSITVEKATTTATKPTTTRSTTTTKTYTIKSGDTLWGIAQKYYGSGSKYTKIYNANKSTIESAAKKHGKSSSSNGHWIYPGTKLNIPQ